MAIDDTRQPLSISVQDANEKVHTQNLDGDQSGSVTPEGNTTVDLDLGTGLPVERTPEQDIEGEGDAPEVIAPEGEAAGTTEGDDPEAKEGDLPAYVPDDPDVLAAYDAKYTIPAATEGGAPQLNLDAFNDEVIANTVRDEATGEIVKLDINPDSRAWLRDTYGLDDNGIDTYLAGKIAQGKAADEAAYSIIGSKEVFDAAYTWAKENYTQAQRDAYNEAAKKGDPVSREAQLALLKTRFEKANPDAVTKKATTEVAKAETVKAPGRRAASPKANATSVPAGAGKAPEGFKSQEDHATAQAAAGSDPVKIAAVRARLRASKWYQDSLK